jgi:hypothetical protein
MYYMHARYMGMVTAWPNRKIMDVYIGNEYRFSESHLSMNGRRNVNGIKMLFIISKYI